MTLMRRKIDEFVEGITDETIVKLFEHYHQGCYDGLLPNLRRDVPTSKRTERKALHKYLNFYIEDPDADNERKEKLTKCVELCSETLLFVLIQNDQYFEEPLFYMLNKGSY